MRTGYETDARNNQTPLHRALVEASYLWAINKGTAKGIRAASEFCPTHGYSADLLAMLVFTGQHYNQRYMPEKELYYSDNVLIFEAKASKFDFVRHFNDRENPRVTTPLGTLHWVVTDDGLVDKEEIPSFWGLLEKTGRGLRETKRPRYCPITQERLCQIGYDLLWARENWQREYECARIMAAVEKMQGKPEGETK